MKKILVLITVCCLTSLLLPRLCFGTAFISGGFEEGLTKPYNVEKTGIVKVVENTASSGKYSAYVSNRTSNRVSVSFDITSFISKDIYKYGVELKLDDVAFDYAKFYCGISILTDKGNFEYKTEAVKVVNEEFTAIGGEEALSWEGELISAEIYIQNYSESEYNNVFIDNFYIEYVGEIDSADNFIKFADTTVGVFRKDVWKDSATANALIEELSPARYRRFMPFNYDIEKKTFMDSDLSFKYELEYAEYMGIDFFAYYWNSGTSFVPRHLKSSTSVKFCLVIENDMPIEQIDTALESLKSDLYQCINGECILIFESGVGFSERLLAFKSKAQSKDIKLCIGLISTNPTQRENVDFSVLDTAADENIIAEEEKAWASAASITKNFIPICSAGGTLKETYSVQKRVEHIKNAIKLSGSLTNCVIINSWNGYQDGHNICPAYKVDGSGNYVISKNDRYVIDTSLAGALMQVLGGDASKSIVTEVGYVSKTGNGESAPPATSITAITTPDANDGQGFYDDNNIEGVVPQTPYTTATITPLDKMPKKEFRLDESAIALIVTAAITAVAAVGRLIIKKVRENNEKKS